MGADPVLVFATGAVKPGQPLLLNDNVCITLRFADGSVASIVYTADGAKAMPKEHVEMFGGGRCATIDDFRSVSLYEGDTGVRQVKGTQNKGQPQLLAAWVDGMRSGVGALPIGTALAVSAATIAAVESMTLGEAVPITPLLWQADDQAQAAAAAASLDEVARP